MIENALSRKGYSSKAKITIKSFVSVALTALAVALPMLVHAVGGSEGGVKWLPMYLRSSSFRYEMGSYGRDSVADS